MMFLALDNPSETPPQNAQNITLLIHQQIQNELTYTVMAK